jgi:hypothetical protein
LDVVGFLRDASLPDAGAAPGGQHDDTIDAIDAGTDTRNAGTDTRNAGNADARAGGYLGRRR